MDSRIDELKKSVDAITSDDYCAREMDTVGSEVGDALKTVIHYAEIYIEVAEEKKQKGARDILVEMLAAAIVAYASSLPLTLLIAFLIGLTGDGFHYEVALFLSFFFALIGILTK